MKTEFSVYYHNGINAIINKFANGMRSTVMTLEIHEKWLEEMSNAWNGPTHAQQAQPSISGEICDVRVMIGETKTPLDFY